MVFLWPDVHDEKSTIDATMPLGRYAGFFSVGMTLFAFVTNKLRTSRA